MLTDYLVHLKTLKDFFITHHDALAASAVNASFFNEWLASPFIEQRMVDPTLTAERIERLENDVMTSIYSP